MTRLLLALAVLVAVAIVLFQVGALVYLKAYRLPAGSMSMEPTLRPGERFAVVRFTGPVEPDRGDVVAFRTPPRAASLCGAGGTFVQRIVGLPGERIEERRGVFFVDGRRLPEPYVRNGRRDRRSGRWRVPPARYFLAGDNRTHSCDSRVWGPVSASSLVGEAVLTYWPPGRIGFR